MKTHDTTSDQNYKSRAAASDQQQKMGAEKGRQTPPGPTVQRNPEDMINGSPYMVSQRKRLHSFSGQTLQMQPEEEEELMQGKSAAQMQAEEDEELMQGKSATQMQAEEDEELMQGKFAAQMQPEEEEELMQGKFAIQKQTPEEDEELMQGKFPAQKQANENRTGIPDDVRTSAESTFNTDFSNVRVHPNSQKATDVGALAYTQGTDIHFAPGQFMPESSAGRQLLGHELTHVVQQGQGRVKPTGEVEGLPVNDSPDLEQEADAMGKKV